MYVLKSDYAVASEILAGVYDRLASRLKQATPVFCKRLAPGLGLAEDPGRTESFGLNRCRLLADGMIRAFEQGKTSLSERLKVVDDRFAEAGLSLDRPFLNPGSPDVYSFPRRRQPRSVRSSDAREARQTPTSSTSFLQTAEQIAAGLLQEAIWHDGRCNWLSVVPEEYVAAGRPPDESVGRAYRAIGPDLYDGTSGIALFLAELYAVNRAPATRRTALGAIRQAIESVDTVPLPVRLGLYAGWTGIALAAARVGLLLDEVELSERAGQLLRLAVTEADAKHELDLIAGSAGAIVGLLVLAAMLDDRSLVALADQLGDELLRKANTSEGFCSWPSPAFPKQRDLTGYSHGTAGVGSALLELYSATGDPRYRETAEQAFNYERFWFDRDARMFGLPELHLFVTESMERWWEAFRWERYVAAHGLFRTVAQLYYGEQTDETARLAREWVQSRLACDTTSVFRELVEKAHPRILVDKSPSTVNQPARLCRLREIFPNARFLHLVRHPRGNCESIVAWRLLRNKLAYNPTAWDLSTDPPTFDPQNYWYTSHTNICHFLASVPAERQLRVRGEDVLLSPDRQLRVIVEWLGLQSTPETIDLMKHPERSPFACFGPAGARWGNDPSFLRNPALRPERVRTYSLAEPVSWRADGAGLSADARALAQKFGYS